MHEIWFNTAAIDAIGFTASEVASNSQVNLADGHFWEAGIFAVAAPKIAPLLLKPARVALGLNQLRDVIKAGGITTIGDIAFGTIELEMEWAAMSRLRAPDDAVPRTVDARRRQGRAAARRRRAGVGVRSVAAEAQPVAPGVRQRHQAFRRWRARALRLLHGRAGASLRGARRARLGQPLLSVVARRHLCPHRARSGSRPPNLRLGTVARHGIPVALHSDFTIAPMQPLLLAWIAANRATEGGG
jgi:predicted amidohydrolase YtcJ